MTFRPDCRKQSNFASTIVCFLILVSPCDSAPCENRGGCLNVGDSFECECPSGYSGKRCQNKGTKEYFDAVKVGLLSFKV